MKKKIFCLTTIIALMFITFMSKPVDAASQTYEPASIYPITESVEFYNSNNEKITTLQMNNGDTTTVTAKIKFKYISEETGTVSKIPVKYYIDSSSPDLELISAKNGSNLDDTAILGYNTDYEVIYDGKEHTDCYVYQTFQVKANANVSNATIGFVVDVNLEGSEYSDSYYVLPVFVIDEADLTEYTVNGGDGNSILFENEVGKDFYFGSIDYTSITDEEMKAWVEESNGFITFEEIKAELDFILENAKNAVNGRGDILKVFEFNLYDDDAEVHNAPNGFKIKIKITDDIKGYDSYELFYIKGDGTTEDAITLTKNGDYLEGALPHLSTYALVGNNNETSDNETSNTEETTTNTDIPVQENTSTENTSTDNTSAENNSTKNNSTKNTTISNSPKTGDNIIMWISLITVSALGIVGIIKYAHKKE